MTSKNNMQSHRLAAGGVIDRNTVLHFRFNGKAYIGHAGDTLASALLANGVRLLARSFKYHRPRGVLSAGPEEPNALVQLGVGAATEPNTRATMISLFDGLEASSQNCWPSLRFDVQAVNDYLSPLMPAGFYYKTFKWPASAWHTYERIIRRAAGMGRAPHANDPDRYQHQHVHVDILIAGGGVAGIAAALSAARSGARVMLADERALLGGLSFDPRSTIDGLAVAQWVQQAVAQLAALPNVTLLPRTTVFGYYDHNRLALVERHAETAQTRAQARQRLWQVTAQQVILASGAIEQPLAFGNNDLPGIYLASAARAYVLQYGVRLAQRGLVYGNHDGAIDAALDLHDAGVPVVAYVDVRPVALIAPARVQALRARGIALHAASVISHALGRSAVKGVWLRDDQGRTQRVACDAVAMSGGWAPAVHLHSQSGGKLDYDVQLAAFVPAQVKQATRSAGAARGVFGLQAVLDDGVAAGADAVLALGLAAVLPLAVTVNGELAQQHAIHIQLPVAPIRGKCFIDFQADVTLDDIGLAVRENYRSVEHLKRYTTLGMGTDQGKTSNLNGLGLLARQRDEAIPAVGTTTFRPPYTPVTLGLLAGAAIGERAVALRLTPLHAEHQRQGASFVQLGAWLRPAAYPQAGEDLFAAAQREAANVRSAVGLADISTIGKIDVQGPDAQLFLDRVYSNDVLKLAVGKARYGLLLREDGVILDDGSIARLAAQHYLLTTTTVHAGKVLSHLEWLLAAVWPELRVRVASLTEQLAHFVLAGPRSRQLLEHVLQVMLDDAVLPALGVVKTAWQDMPLTLCRLSFSGETAYELLLPAAYATTCWRRLQQVGQAWGLSTYGADAIAILRIEAGHVAGPELDGRTTPGDLGLQKMASKARPFVGHRLLQRPGLQDPLRPQLIGVLSVDPQARLRPGAALLAADGNHNIGWISSAAWSPHLQRSIALGFVHGGREHEGQTLTAASPLHDEAIAVTIVAPRFIHQPTLAAGIAVAQKISAAAIDAAPVLLPAHCAALCSVRTYPLALQIAALDQHDSTHGALRDGLQRLTGITPPDPNCSSGHGARQILATGPGRWLLLSGDPGDAFLAALVAAELAAVAAVTDAAGGLLNVLHLPDASAIATLNTCCGLDLTPTAFAAGDCRATAIHGMPLLLWRRAAGEGVELIVGRSLLVSLAEWLAASVGVDTEVAEALAH